mmetsp:Transcript_86137/g.171013  ORF Transcript_86137/g.171013 Transcript_86137/m.171013 type:complete len:305 (+) Transcript_86137:38-952(+)
MAVAAAEANAECEALRRTGRTVAVSSFVEVMGEPSEKPGADTSPGDGRWSMFSRGSHVQEDTSAGNARWSMFSRGSNVQASASGTSRASFAEVPIERQRQVDEERRAAMENKRQRQSFQMLSVEEQKSIDQQAIKAQSERPANRDRKQTWEVAIDRFNAEATEGRSSAATNEDGPNGTTRDAATTEEDAGFSPDTPTNAVSAATTKTAPAVITTGPPASAASASDAEATLPAAATNASFIICPVTTGTYAPPPAASLSDALLQEPGGASPLPGPAFRLPPKLQPQREQRSAAVMLGNFFMCCSR